jgi:hypothetical protein
MERKVGGEFLNFPLRLLFFVTDRLELEVKRVDWVLHW